MSIEIKVPVLPESITDATIAKWYKKEGDAVARDENIVDLETDKVMLEVPAIADGVLEKIIKPEGSVVKAQEVIALLKEGVAVVPKPAAPAKAAEKAAEKTTDKTADKSGDASGEDLSPAVRRLIAENNLELSQIRGTGKNGRILKEDVEKVLQGGASAGAKPAATGRVEERVPMSRLRARIAERLVQVQHAGALLTTFNEINMKPVMDIRKKYKDQFEKTFGTRLGFMSFFTKACVEALKRFPAVNASIDGTDILYHNYYDIGIAVGSDRGLVVPVVRDADQLSMADIERQIREYAEKAQSGKLTLEEMTGGTFTITNGGTYGSMLSTPIINAPQSAILGMHNIIERPIAENGEIVIRPMMYVALTYDHRIIDGKEAVQFLVMVKEILEDPARMTIGV